MSSHMQYTRFNDCSDFFWNNVSVELTIGFGSFKRGIFFAYVENNLQKLE